MTKLRQNLLDALRALRVFESQWEDLSYPEGDPRRQMPDAEMPPELVAERSQLEREVVRAAARYSGEPPEMADVYADTPHSMQHNYNVECIRFAVTLSGWSL